MSNWSGHSSGRGNMSSSGVPFSGPQSGNQHGRFDGGNQGFSSSQIYEQNGQSQSIPGQFPGQGSNQQNFQQGHWNYSDMNPASNGFVERNPGSRNQPHASIPLPSGFLPTGTQPMKNQMHGPDLSTARGAISSNSGLSNENRQQLPAGRTMSRASEVNSGFEQGQNLRGELNVAEPSAQSRVRFDSMNSNDASGTGSGFTKRSPLDLNVEMAIKKEQSIVIPTMPKGLQEEFMRRAKGEESAVKPYTPKMEEPSRSVEHEDMALTSVLVDFLKQRHSANPNMRIAPAQIVELYVHIEYITARKWSPYWEQFHGSLVMFLRRHAEFFVVIEDRYVTLHGFEHLTALPVELLQIPQSVSYSPPQQMLPFVGMTEHDYFNSPPMTNPFNPVNVPMELPYYRSDPISDYNVASLNTDDDWVLFKDDMAAYDTSNPFNVLSDEEKSRREEEEQRRKKKQEEDDEKLALRLQAELNRSPESGNGVRVSLLRDELRLLAEKELGKDNIRILSGFTVSKISKKGRSSQRKMWINSSLTHLTWESHSVLRSGEHRGFLLSRVKDLLVGRMTPSIRRCTADEKKVRALCFSLDGLERTIDLQACSVIQRDALVTAIRKALEFNRKHKPTQLDEKHTTVIVF